MKQRHCDVCRAPAALMPCSRCILPGPHTAAGEQSTRQMRPSHPILLEGKYRLLEEIGRGGMGTVFRAVDEILERPVAIKFLLPEIQAMPTAVERFRREAKAMASISDHNVVRVFSFGRYGAADFIVTEYIDGPTLEEMIDRAYKREEHIPLEHAVDLLLQSTRGLAAIHAAGVIHRDIKPGNIMYEPEMERALIMDFGIGRRVARESETSAVAPGGTPAYMAPEIIVSREVNTLQEHLIDIYAFGVTAFELLTNRLPFDGETWIEVLEKHLELMPPRPSEFRPELTKELEELVLTCLRKKPQERFQSAKDLHQALQAINLSPRASDNRTSSLPSATQRRPAHIVVADADTAFRSQVFELVRRQTSCEISSAPTAAQALDFVEQGNPVLLISNLHDRSFNGLELAATLGHALDEQRAALILTADHVSPAEAGLLQRLGAVQVVRKPLVEGEMLAALQSAVRMLDLEMRKTRPTG